MQLHFSFLDFVTKILRPAERNEQVLLVSGHEVNMLAFLKGLDLVEDHTHALPPTGSILEIHITVPKDGEVKPGMEYVRIFYNGEEQTSHVCKSFTACPVALFAGVLRRYSHEANEMFFAECGLEKFFKGKPMSMHADQVKRRKKSMKRMDQPYPPPPPSKGVPPGFTTWDPLSEYYLPAVDVIRDLTDMKIDNTRVEYKFKHLHPHLNTKKVDL